MSLVSTSHWLHHTFPFLLLLSHQFLFYKLQQGVYGISRAHVEKFRNQDVKFVAKHALVCVGHSEFCAPNRWWRGRADVASNDPKIMECCVLWATLPSLSPFKFWPISLYFPNWFKPSKFICPALSLLWIGWNLKLDC